MDSLSSRFLFPLNSGQASANLVPRRDEIFVKLLDGAVQGGLPVYFAIIPRSLVRPFDASCNVELHPACRAAVGEVVNDWRASKFHYAWVYPHEGAYVLSDDYVIRAAVERSQVNYLPCWVLGFPSIEGAVATTGPLDVSVVRLIRDGLE